MKPFSTILKEAVFVGVLLIIIVYIVGWGMTSFGYPKGNIDPSCSNWNKSYFMEVCLLLSGMIFHIGCEYTGLNKWYVDNYYSTSSTS